MKMKQLKFKYKEKKQVDCVNNLGSIGNCKSNLILKSRLSLFIMMGIMIFVIMLAINLGSVSAIGITPGRTSMNFSPNLATLDANVNFQVFNTDKKDMNVAFTVEGELKDYITLSEDVVFFSSGQESKSFSYHVSINENTMLSPGLHSAEIVALELPKGTDDVGTVIQTTVSVVTQLYIFVLYPGKHINSDLNVVEKEDNVYLYVPLISRGNESIDSVFAEIEIYDVSNSLVKKIETNMVSLGVSEKSELVGLWNEIKDGNYKAKVIVKYDGMSEIFEKDFSIGDDLNVIGISVNDFVLGDIAKVNILVQNKQNKALTDAYANLKVYDSNLREIKNLNFEHYEISSKANQEMLIYWDTEGLSEGIYPTELRINYNDGFIDKQFKVDVSKNKMSFSGVGFVIAEESPNGFSVMTILYVVIGVLILVNLLWLISWIRGKKKKTKK